MGTGFQKVVRIAWREFASTVLTKGFIIGVLITPVMIVAIMSGIMLLVATQREPVVEGTVAIIDRTGVVAPRIADDLSPERYAERIQAQIEGIQRGVSQLNPLIAEVIGESSDQAIEVPQISIEVLPPDTDIEAEKERVRLGGHEGPGGTDRLALAIISEFAVEPGDREQIRVEAGFEAPQPVRQAEDRPEDQTDDQTEDRPAGQAEDRTGDSAEEAASEGDSASSEGDGPVPSEADPDIGSGDGAVAEDAEEADTGPHYGGFRLFVRPKLNSTIEDQIRSSLYSNIRAERFLAADVDQGYINRLRSVNASRTTELTEDGGERVTLGEFKNFIPYGFMLAMLIPVFVGGQYLMTTTIEEKGSRVVEVLLSAVSPMQLMGGKILGQMFVGLAILVIYGGLGIGALVMFSLTDLLSVFAIVMMLVFFLIAYFTYASFMAAIGAAVNEMREAQSLLGPVMIPLMIPYALGIFIAQDPDSLFATVCSFIPPINPFVMMLRVASTEPPPLWEVGLSLAIALATCVAAVWLAAKIFRVGLLMHGKAPNLATLIKWVRLA